VTHQWTRVSSIVVFDCYWDT